MKRLLLALAIVLFSGCAVQPTEQASEANYITVEQHQQTIAELRIILKLEQVICDGINSEFKRVGAPVVCTSITLSKTKDGYEGVIQYLDVSGQAASEKIVLGPDANGKLVVQNQLEAVSIIRELDRQNKKRRKF